MKQLVQISHGRKLHRSRHFSVTSGIGALRRKKETTDENGFIGEIFH